MREIDQLSNRLVECNTFPDYMLLDAANILTSVSNNSDRLFDVTPDGLVFELGMR